MLRQDDYCRAKLVDVGWMYGSEYGGHLAACIVMSCVSNRVKNGWGNWLDVIDSIPKFLATDTPPVFNRPSIWEPAFVRLLHEVEPIQAGTQDYAKGGCYWADTRRIDTAFFQNKILCNKEAHPRTIEMNSFVAFK